MEKPSINSPYTHKSKPLSEIWRLNWPCIRKPTRWCFGNYYFPYQGKINWKQFWSHAEGSENLNLCSPSYDGEISDTQFQSNCRQLDTMDFGSRSYHLLSPKSTNSNHFKQRNSSILYFKKGRFSANIRYRKSNPTIQSKEKLPRRNSNLLTIWRRIYGVKANYLHRAMHFLGMSNVMAWDYPLWVGNYNPVCNQRSDYWSSLQFSEEEEWKGYGEKSSIWIWLRGGSRTFCNIDFG